MFEPEYGALVDILLTEHAELQIHARFPNQRLKTNIMVVCAYNESPIAKEMWSIPMAGGCLIGEWLPVKEYSTINAIFLVRTVLFDWQYKRSQFEKKRFVQIKIRRINSTIQNKLRNGKECKKECVVAWKAVSSRVLDANQQNSPSTLFAPKNWQTPARGATLQYQTHT